jgi:periplasmic divalent cation tolerance protein
MACQLVYVTCPSREVALDIAKAVVEAKLAACANVHNSGMTSVYHWQGKLETSDEFLLLLKTTTETTPLLIEKIKALHPYEVPCIVALDIVTGHEPFLQWIQSELL